jgi:hypothetical protein
LFLKTTHPTHLQNPANILSLPYEMFIPLIYQFMKLNITRFLSICIITTVLFSCKENPTKNNRLGNATREDKNGWIYVHLAGSPADVGYQHGFLVAKEIDTLIKVMQYYLPTTSGKDWAFYRAASKRFLWKKIDKEYQDEI